MIGICQTNVDTAGGTIRPLQTSVVIGDSEDPVAVVGCSVDSHPPCELPSPPHCTAHMAEGEPSIVIEEDGVEMMVCFEGHLADCGHAATGRDHIVLEVA